MKSEFLTSRALSLMSFDLRHSFVIRHSFLMPPWPPSEKTISSANFGGLLPAPLRPLAKTPLSSAASCRGTSAPTGLRNIAQGCRALASAPLGVSHQTGKQTQHSATPQAHQQRLPSAPPHLCRTRTTLQSTNPRSVPLTERHSCERFELSASVIREFVIDSSFLILVSSFSASRPSLPN